MPAKPRIAVCIGAFEYGGQGTVVEQELQHLRGRFDITLVAEKIRRPVPPGAVAAELSAWSIFPLPNPALMRYFRGFDLVHCHDSLGLMLAARAAGKPYVVTAHGIAPIRLRSTARSAVEGAITAAAYPSLYRSARSVVAISSYIAQWVKKFAGVEAQTISNGIKEVAAGGTRRPRIRRLLYVGEISRRKGIADSIAALELSPPDVVLDLVGKGDSAPFRARAQALHLADRVRFRGILSGPALSAAYAESLSTYSASFWEGFGLPVLEGFAFGRPAIVRAQGGMKELVEQAHAGRCFERLAEVPACIEFVTSHWQDLSQRAASYARAHTWADTFRAYSELFHRLA